MYSCFASCSRRAYCAQCQRRRSGSGSVLAYGVVLHVRVLDELGAYLGAAEVARARVVAERVAALLRPVQLGEHLWRACERRLSSAGRGCGCGAYLLGFAPLRTRCCQLFVGDSRGLTEIVAASRMDPGQTDMRFAAGQVHTYSSILVTDILRQRNASSDGNGTAAYFGMVKLTHSFTLSWPPHAAL